MAARCIGVVRHKVLAGRPESARHLRLAGDGAAPGFVGMLGPGHWRSTVSLRLGRPAPPCRAVRLLGHWQWGIAADAIVNVRVTVCVICANSEEAMCDVLPPAVLSLPRLIRSAVALCAQ